MSALSTTDTSPLASPSTPSTDLHTNRPIPPNQNLNATTPSAPCRSVQVQNLNISDLSSCNPQVLHDN
ncbi:Hypothetical predicted protein, partial [Olea europaea subsp. europaea]